MTAGLIYDTPGGDARSGEVLELGTVHLNSVRADLPEFDDPRVLEHQGGVIYCHGDRFEFEDDDHVYITDTKIVVSPHPPNKVLDN